MLRFLSILALIQKTEGFYDPTKPIVKMADYKSDHRTMDCWECFEAEGKMCHDVDHGSMISRTGSSNKGHGVCCK